MADVIRIGDIARHTHKSPRAVRLYEEMGLLGSVFRTEGGHRLYDGEVLERIAWIDKLQALGFSLPQIKGLLGEWTESVHGPQAMSKVRDLFRAKLEETRAQIKTLESLSLELEESLAYLESCESCRPSTLLGACACCQEPHAVQREPPLVAGLHPRNGQDP